MPVDDVFLSRVTHDLRGELATMIAGVHYLLRYEAGLGAQGRQMLERVNSAGQRQRRLLDGAPEGAVPTAEPCALEPIVRAAVGRLASASAQRGVTIDLRAADELPEIEVDPDLVGPAIELAIDFAIARSPSKTVRVACAIEEGAVAIRVEDEGGEVDAGVLGKIFEPFVEREIVAKPEPGARRRERLGLGLAIARGVFLAHGGSATAEPIEGGLALTLRLRASGCLAPPAV